MAGNIYIYIYIFIFIEWLLIYNTEGIALAFDIYLHPPRQGSFCCCWVFAYILGRCTCLISFYLCQLQHASLISLLLCGLLGCSRIFQSCCMVALNDSLLSLCLLRCHIEAYLRQPSSSMSSGSTIPSHVQCSPCLPLFCPKNSACNISCSLNTCIWLWHSPSLRPFFQSHGRSAYYHHL